MTWTFISSIRVLVPWLSLLTLQGPFPSRSPTLSVPITTPITVAVDDYLCTKLQLSITISTVVTVCFSLRLSLRLSIASILGFPPFVPQTMQSPNDMLCRGVGWTAEETADLFRVWNPASGNPRLVSTKMGDAFGEKAFKHLLDLTPSSTHLKTYKRHSPNSFRTQFDIVFVDIQKFRSALPLIRSRQHTRVTEVKWLSWLSPIILRIDSQWAMTLMISLIRRGRGTGVQGDPAASRILGPAFITRAVIVNRSEESDGFRDHFTTFR